MYGIGKTLLSGSRFVFWSITPVALVTGLAFPFLLSDWSTQKIALTVALELAIALLCLTLYDPRRFTWAARSLAGLVFVGFAAGLVDALVWPSQETAGAGAPSDRPLTKALLGVIAIGLPCLWFALHGRRRPRWLRDIRLMPIVVYRGIDLPQERVAELDRRARAALADRHPRRTTNLLTAGILVLIFIVAGAHNWLTREVPLLANPFAYVGLLVLLLFVTVCPLVWIAIRAAQVRLVKQFRREARADGIEICLTCGLCLVELAPHAGECPGCGAGRIPLAPP